MPETFRSLRHRNARLFFAGMLVSNVGTWIQTTATALLVLKLTGKGTSLGIITAAQFLPMLLLGPWAGVLADRTNRRRMTMITQTGLTVQAVALAVADLTHHATVGLIAFLALVLGTFSALDNPARRGVVTELVDEEDVANALSLNTAVMTGSRVFGPALAGLMVATIGTGWCFVANAVSFVAVLGGLARMNPAELRVPPRAPRGGRPLRDGLAFVARDPLLRPMFIALTIVSTFAFNYNVSLPLLVKQKFDGGATGVGWLLATTSIGSVIGSLTVASRRSIGARAYALAMVVLGLSAALLGASGVLPVAFVLAVPMGVGGAGFLAVTNGVMQPRTPPAMRGRLLALQATAFLGSTVIGGPITGWIGDHVGAGWAISYGGLITLAVAAWFVWTVRRTPATVPGSALVPTPA